MKMTSIDLDAIYEEARPQILRPERLVRGEAGTWQTQPIESATWVWSAADAEFIRLRCPFRTETADQLVVDVSADERFILFLDGVEVGRGPHLGMPERWFYATYEMDVPAGEHLLEAVAWRIGPGAPISQLSFAPGFILKAHGAFDALLTTGKAPWTAATLGNTRILDRQMWPCGPVEIFGTSFLDETPPDTAFAPVRTVREPPPERRCRGARGTGWVLFPAVLPDQTREWKAPGAFVGEDALVAAMNALLAHVESGDAGVTPAGGPAVVFPPRTHVRLLWDLGDYYCAWPHLETAGGRGAEVRWQWYEALVGPDGMKGNRGEWIGKGSPADARGLVICRPDGRSHAVFEPPWWRAGRWCELEVRTGAEPLEVTALSLFESRYPMAVESRFECDDPTLDDVQRICLRGLEMCMHEIYFDCPYYEQQMYCGDTRVEMLVTGAVGSDDRLIRHGAALLDCARRDDGMLPMNWPTRRLQESAAYTLFWPLMLADYAMQHDNVDWLKARIPGLRHTMAGFLRYENADGLVAGLPGWSFADWVPEWPRGVPPDGEDAVRPSAFNNLLYLAALRAAALVESVAGDGDIAAHFKKRADKLADAVFRTFWCEERGLVADTVEKDLFSEHAQCLALLNDALPEEKRERCFRALVEDGTLSRTSVYFSHYLFATYFRFGRGDLFLKRLDIWRDFVKAGLRTPPETAEATARSDCHAWGSHPLYHLHAGIVGVRPAAPGFRVVRVTPCPGPLKRIRSATSHPAGVVECDLGFAEGGVAGSVTLPAGIPGVFVWQGSETPLVPGRNEISVSPNKETKP